MNIEHLDMDTIVPNREQPRYRFDDKSLNELERSIERNGIIQPIVVKKVDSSYRIIAGERRWRAAMKLNMREIPAIVRDVDLEEEMEMAIVENIQREDLNSIEEAKAIRRYIDKTGCTQDDISKILGKSRSYISNTMRLLNLPQDIIKEIELGNISAGHGRALLSASSDFQKELVNRIKLEKLSVRDIEELIAGKKKTRQDNSTLKSKKSIKRKDIFLEDLEERITESIGLKVSIDRGRIQINYSGNDDLEKISRILLEND